MQTHLSSGRRKHASARLLPIVGLLLLLPLAACDDGDDGLGPARAPTVQVMITDAPSDYVAAAEIWVSRVYLQPGDDDDLDDDGVDDGEDEDVQGRVFLFDDPENPRRFDLLLLRDGVVEVLTEAVEVEPARYGQLRLVVDSAFVTLEEPYTFRDGSTTSTLFVPSGAQSGIKVNLQGAIDADEGDDIEILVDMDVDRNFVIQGNPDSPAGIRGVLFTPTLQEIDRDDDADDAADDAR